MFKIMAVYLVLAATLHAAVSSPLETSVSSSKKLDGTLTPRDAWSDRVLSLHNSNRARYGAKPLQWASDLYPGALSWAQQCKFAHSGGNYGENLYAATGNGDTLASGLSAWMAESSKYDYNNPRFSSDTGHFTQVVWKGTTRVACAVANCGANTIFSQPSQYLVCRYSPPGNVQGQFGQNVGRQT